MENQNLEQRVKELLSEILGYLDIEYSSEVEHPTEEKLYFNLRTTSDSLLVGYHGHTLNSLQFLINIFLSKELGEHAPIVIDVSNYRKNKETKLREMASNAASKAKELNKSVSLYPMSSYERKIVHEVVNAIEGVRSYSEGDGPNRKVIISMDSENDSGADISVDS